MSHLFRRSACIIVLSALFSLSLLAQENFKPGYIVKTSGDTIRGSIDQRNWARSPQKINFRSNSGSAEEFAPLNIKGFGVNDVRYESAIVETEKLLPDNDIYAKVQYQKIIDTVFIEAVIVGPKSLYEFRVGGNSKFYFIKKDDGYELLSYRRYTKLGADKLTHMVEVKLFQGQLSSYLNGCTDIDKKIKTVKYERQSFEGIFTYYYKCTNAPLKFVKKQDPVQFQFGVLAGMTNTSLHFTSQGHTPQAGAKFNTSSAPTFGIFVNIIAPGPQKKWSLYNDLAYSSFSSHNFDSEAGNPVSYTTSSSYGDKYLKLNDIIRYHIKLNASAQIFIGGGLANRLSMGPSPNHYVQYETINSSPPTMKEGEVILVTRKFSQGLVADAGVQVGKFSLEFRYDHGSSVLGQHQGSLQSFIHTLFFNFGYRIN